MKFLSRIAILVIAMLSLTGCMKMTMDLTVNPNDTVDGKVVFAISKQLADLGGGADEIQTDNLFDTEVPGVTKKKLDDGSWVGTEYTLSAVPLSQFKPGEDASELAIVRNGDQLIVSGLLDAGSEEMDAETLAMIESMSGSMVLRISITLPGEIVSTDGEVNGNTITWKLNLSGTTPINAVAKSQLQTGAPAGLIAGVVAALVLIALLVVLLSRRNNGDDQPQDVAAVMDGEATDSTNDGDGI